MRLFQKLKKDAPEGVIPDGTTVQGVYCLTPDGKFLSGYFAWATAKRARDVIRRGWERFEEHARQTGKTPRPIPTDTLDYALGDREPYVKLEAAVRDLPRGREHPTHFYNLGWVDVAKDELEVLVAAESKVRLPDSVLRKLETCLKDSVRGQCYDWKPSAERSGELYAECIDRHAGARTIRVTGQASFQETSKSFRAQLHGLIEYDTIDESITRFDLVASGQRSGKCRFNNRDDDLGPAPMGVAFRLYRSQAQSSPRIEGTLVENGEPRLDRRLTLARRFETSRGSRWASVFETRTDAEGRFALKLGVHALEDPFVRGAKPTQDLCLLVHDETDPRGSAHEQNYVYRQELREPESTAEISLDYQVSRVTVSLRSQDGEPLRFFPRIQRLDKPEWREIGLQGNHHLRQLNAPTLTDEETFSLEPGEYLVILEAVGADAMRISAPGKKIRVEPGEDLEVVLVASELDSDG